jgi:hypothetical protein
MGAQTASTGSKVGTAHLNYALCEEQRSFGLTVLPTFSEFVSRSPSCTMWRHAVRYPTWWRHLLLLPRNFLLSTHIVESNFSCKFFGFGCGRGEISILGYDTCALGLGYRSFEMISWLKLIRRNLGGDTETIICLKASGTQYPVT